MSIKKFVEYIEVNKLKKDYVKNIKLFNEIEKFVKKKNFILYGGFALNLILPESYKIYKEYTLADIDCYSYDAKNDAILIANILKKKKYSMIKVKLAKHENTYKVFVGSTSVLDITHLDKNLYNIFIKIHNYEKHNGLLKYYNNNYYIVPLYLLKRDMHYELSRPEGSYFRWEKIESRLKLLNKTHFTLESNIIRRGNCIKYRDKNFFKINHDLFKCLKMLLKYIKDNKTPIIDNYALKFINKIEDKNCCKLNNYANNIIILSKNYNKNCKDIVKIIKKSINRKKYDIIILKKNLEYENIDILKDRFRIVIHDKKENKRFSLISIIKVKADCFSTQQINGYTIGTIDTILCFLYSYYLTYLFTKYRNYRHNSVLQDTQEYIDIYEKILKKINVSNRYKVECFGKELSKDDIYKKNWDKSRLTLVKI